MSREWKAGDVAMVPGLGIMCAGEDGFWYRPTGTRMKTPWRPKLGYALFPVVRPLVVIDPEDRAQVERLLSGFMSGNEGNFIANANDLQAALREFADPKPPKPEVYSHVIVSRSNVAVSSLCGKLFTPDPDANVVGKCPVCLAATRDEGWTA